MTDAHLDNEEDKPLDPAAEKLRRKMLRLMVISIGSMFIGIFAVLFAIVYKMNNAPSANTDVNVAIELPAGFAIEETQLNDGVVLFRGKMTDGTSKILLFDPLSGNLRGTIELNESK